jgi:hypothetical protein
LDLLHVINNIKSSVRFEGEELHLTSVTGTSNMRVVIYFINILYSFEFDKLGREQKKCKNILELVNKKNVKTF